MTHEKLVVLGLLFIIGTCTGCDNNDSKINKPSVQEETEETIGDIENTENTENQADLTQSQNLKVPHTQEEMEEAFGTVDEEGNWTAPEGSYIDPKTGNILNKDGVLVGTTQKPYYNARPGSQG